MLCRWRLTCNENARRTNYVTLEALAKSATSPPPSPSQPDSEPSNLHHYHSPTQPTNHSPLHQPNPFLKPTPRDKPNKRSVNKPSRRNQEAHLLCPAQSKTSSLSVRSHRPSRRHFQVHAAACALAGRHAISLCAFAYRCSGNAREAREVMWCQREGQQRASTGAVL